MFKFSLILLITLLLFLSVGIVLFAYLHMVQHIELLGKGTATFRAFEWPFLLVHMLHVLVQVGSLHKGDSAVAHKRALPGVRPQVVIELTRALNHSVATVLELAMEQPQEIAVLVPHLLLELVDDVLGARGHLVFVICFGGVEGVSHDDLYTP